MRPVCALAHVGHDRESFGQGISHEPQPVLTGLPRGHPTVPPIDSKDAGAVTLPPALADYLPADLWHKLSAETPRRGVLLSALDRLRSILYLLATYLPQHLVQEKMRRPVPGQVRGQWLNGSLLFADVSGFTALSERLASLGREGTEQLTQAINRYFGAMLDVLGKSGGILLKFAGDALLVYFPEMEGGEQARWAVRAGQRMMAAMPQFAAIGTPLGPSAALPSPAFGTGRTGSAGLRMKIGIGTGSFLGASVGTAERMEYVVLGETVARTMAAEGAAEVGLVVADGATAACLDPACCLERAAGFYVVSQDPLKELGDFEVKAGQRRARGAIPWSASPHAIVAQMEVALRQIQALTPYLAPELVEQIVARARQRQVESENRFATVAFVNFTGLEGLLAAWGREGLRRTTDLLDDYFKAMQRVVAGRGGVVSRIDPYSRGSKMLLLFGAPVAHEDDPLRAVSAALAMNDELAALNEHWRQRWASSLPPGVDGPLLQQRIGITQGPTFAGQAGTSTRREYTVMGDDVNLAARLMAAAEPGQVLISQRVYDAVVDHFTATVLPAIRVKGKSLPVPVYAPTGPRDDPLALRLRSRGPLVGRDAEVERGWAALRRLVAGQGMLFTVWGEAGIGKSRLADEWAARALARGVQVLFSACRSYATAAPYDPWITLLEAALGISPTASAEARGHELHCALVELGLALAEYAEPLANLLGLPITAAEAAAHPPSGVAVPAAQAPPRPKPALFARLEQKVAAPKEEGLDLWHLVQARKGVQPGQMWQNLQARVMARQQARLFGAVSGLLARLAADAPLLLLFENAQWMDPASQALIDHLSAQLPGLPIWLLLARRDSDESSGVDSPAREALRLGPLSREETAALASHLLGSVQADEDLAQAIHEQSGGNPLFVEEIVGWLRRSGPAGLHDLQQGLGASGTVQGMVLSHLDSLPLGQRDTLRSASVVGTEFRYGEVRALRPAAPGDETLADELSALEGERLVLATDKGSDTRYAFRQTLVREVGYHSQSVERRRELHSRLAAYLEERHASDLTPYAELLALHHELAGSAQPAARYLLLAGRKARQCYAYAQASGFYERALSVLDSIPTDEWDGETQRLIARAHEGRGDVALLTGAFPDAAAAYEAALTCLPAALPSDLQVKLALVLPTQERAAEAQDYARKAWAAGDAEDLLACTATLAWLLWRAGDAQAAEWIERGRALAGEEKTPRTAAVSALLADLAGDWPAAQRTYLALDRPVGAALAACRQGDRLLQGGDVAGALALYNQAAGVWERENDGCGLALARYRQAEAHLQSGEVGLAQSALVEALRLAETAEALGQEDRQAIEQAIEAVDARQSGLWPPWRWQRYDDEFRIFELFRP